VAERHAAAHGIAVQEIVVMPRPASPYNWTISSSTAATTTWRTSTPAARSRLEAGATGGWLPAFLRAYSAPYQPERLAA